MSGYNPLADPPASSAARVPKNAHRYWGRGSRKVSIGLTFPGITRRRGTHDLHLRQDRYKIPSKASELIEGEFRGVLRIELYARLPPQPLSSAMEMLYGRYGTAQHLEVATPTNHGCHSGI